jgi:hypothetical protein
MTRAMRDVTLSLAMAILAAACTENTAPGNDREARLDAPSEPAKMESAREALSGVAVGLVMPEILTVPDQRPLPDPGEACRFRMTRVGFPVAVYDRSAVTVKLNGRLVSLPATGDGRYADAGVEVTLQPLEARTSPSETVATEFVLRLPGAPNELGFHGVASC